ncbi:cytidine/deoxycytidylate deaminase family protein, partial [Peptococcaceae bacterium]|nr:cytidine/deoxycytidylate deaminase family protein [Peptococcaceae bacterium]
MRPSWDEYFMNITKVIASRSTCLRRKVGALLVKDNHILASGYNGAPSGLKHCLEIGCLREQQSIPSGQRHELCRGLHAEQNVLIQAAVHGVAIEGATVYVTCQPCVLCAKMLIN